MWTQIEIDFLKQTYPTMKKSDIAKYLGKSARTIGRKAKELDLCATYTAWTQEEEDYLIIQLGEKSIPQLAQKLNRTELAVLTKINRMNMGQTRSANEKLTASDIRHAFQLTCEKTVISWIKNHQLKSEKIVTSLKMETYAIVPQDFWIWAEHNQHRINFSKYVPYSILPEPNWLKKAIHHTIDCYPKRKYNRWTTLEDSMLIAYRQQEMPYKQIAKRLERTERSCNLRYNKVKTRYKKHEKPAAR